MITRIIEAMKNAISSRGLELLKRYPNDLLVHDRAMLERYVGAGVKFAWMVGHSHTHMSVLGVHPKINQLPTYVTNLCNDDVFFVLQISSDNQNFTLKEVNRASFPLLAQTTIPFSRVGGADSFSLYKNKNRIGSCSIKVDTSYQERVHNINLTAMNDASEFERRVLEQWACEAAIELAHSLFAKSHVVWGPDLKQTIAA